MDTIKNNFISLLKTLANYSDTQYSGTGLILYDSKLFPKSFNCDLQPHIEFSEKLKLGEKELIDYLKKIGDYSHPLHDGFHFINENGELTHVSQFFSPPLSKNIQPIKGQGARAFTAACGSLVEGVILTGMVSSKNKPYYFNDGCMMEMQDLKNHDD